MTNVKGKSIRLFMVDGTPQGILTLEIVNWTGHVLSSPRSKIAELIQRPEIRKTGVYFLIGPAPDDSMRRCIYIGESDNVGSRLLQHNKDETKDFWESACIITSKDQNLTKAHGRYLEGRLIQIAQEANQAKLFNGTAPKNENLPEADIADMEYFISQIRLVLPVLGLDFLREKPQISSKTEQDKTLEPEETTESPIFEIVSKKHNIYAQAKEVGGEFIVLSGSNAQPTWVSQTNYISYSGLHLALCREGKIQTNSEQTVAIFKEDVAFNSPSAAAAIVYGRPANGRTSWKVKGTDKTYEDWQNDQLKRVDSSNEPDT